MSYAVYADVLFVKHLWMDLLLLFITAWANRTPVRVGRILVAAVLGGLGA